jgi:hypothetical protein
LDWSQDGWDDDELVQYGHVEKEQDCWQHSNSSADRQLPQLASLQQQQKIIENKKKKKQKRKLSDWTSVVDRKQYLPCVLFHMTSTAFCK